MNLGHLSFVGEWSAIGVLAGHLARRASPYLIGLRDRGMPFRWSWPELTGGLLFAVAAVPVGFAPGSTTVRATFVGLLLALVVTDVHRKVLPNLLTWGGTAVGLAMSAWRPRPIEDFLSQFLSLSYVHMSREAPEWIRGLTLAALGAAVGFLLLEGFRRLIAKLTGVDGLGGGDPKLLAMIGAFLGPHAVVLSLLPACAVGAAIGLVHRLRTDQPHVAFGPALAAGGFAVMVAGDALLDLLWRLSLRLVGLPVAGLAAFYALLIGLLVAVVLRMRRRAAAYNEVLDRDFDALERELVDREPPPSPRDTTG